MPRRHFTGFWLPFAEHWQIFMKKKPGLSQSGGFFVQQPTGDKAESPIGEQCHPTSRI
jgi:hypothetical protein